MSTDRQRKANLIYQTNNIELDDITLLSHIKSKNTLVNVIVCTNNANRKYSDLIERLNFEFRIFSSANCDRCKISCNVKELLSTWLFSNCINGASYYTAKAINLISNDIKNVSLYRLSEKLLISERQLSRLIQKNFNKSFRNLINELKIYVIEELVKLYNWSDKDIADFLGYNELNNFHRFIRKKTGKSFKVFSAFITSYCFVASKLNFNIYPKVINHRFIIYIPKLLKLIINKHYPE